MECQKCGGSTTVIETGRHDRKFVSQYDVKLIGGMDFIKRTRACKSCTHRFSTYEVSQSKLESMVM